MAGPVKRQSCWHCLKLYIDGTGVDFEHPDITTKVSINLLMVSFSTFVALHAEHLS